MNEPFKITSDDLKLYTLSNSRGTCIEILNLGATIFNLHVLDKKGNPTNLSVGPKRKEDYLLPLFKEEDRCFGFSVGRYAGRISYGKFSLNGKNYQLYEENGVHLHGGRLGFQHKLWNIESLDNEKNSITLNCLSPSGDEGYPGNLSVKVTYTLTPENVLKIEYSAITDKATPVNITNHTYFNLNGNGSLSDHLLEVNAANILEADEKLRPTGEFVFLEDHPKNFLTLKKIGKMEVDDTYVLEETREFSAVLFAPKSGIRMQVETNQPSLVIYIPKELPLKWEYKSKLADFPSICIRNPKLSRCSQS
jgi:aldose 1-epimerase